MKIEEELKMKSFESEQLKAQLNILFTASWLYNKASVAFKKFGISTEQYNVLRILRGQHGKAICQKDILSRMIDRSSNLTKIIRKLKEKYYVQVDISEVDRREYLITITETGLDLLAAIDKERALQENPLVKLSTSEAFHLNHLLDKIREEE